MLIYGNSGLQQFKAVNPAQISPQCPSKLYLDITEDCNMHCIMCRNKIKSSGEIMDITLYKRVIDETCWGVTSYSLFSWGEPLLVKDFKDRLLYLSKRKLPQALLDISTNGMLLTKDYSKFLLDNDVEVTISFDGATSETFEGIRKGSEFKIISKNLEYLAKISEQNNPIRVPGIYISIQKNNLNELNQIFKYVYNLGVKRIGMGLVIHPNKYRAEVSDQLIEMLNTSIMYANEKKIFIDLLPTKIGKYIWNGINYSENNNYYIDKTCDAPFNTASIGWNGNIYLCCNYGDYVDNINNKKFLDIWNSDLYNEFRKRVNNENMPDRCIDCPWVNRN